MAKARFSVVLVPLSPSFRDAVADLLEEVGLGSLQADGGGGPPPSVPPGVAAVLLLAGGEEPAALDLLAQASPAPSPPWFVIGAAPDHRLAATAVLRGARDYFALPDDLDLLRRTLERAAQTARAQADAETFADAERRQLGFGAIVGRSPPLVRVLDQARRVAEHGDVTVLIGGETGTGKELLARAIHYHSPRRPRPFLEINCAAIPGNLLESELFGYERGAFTGAIQAKPGLFELADGGSVFLDEIGHLPLDLQPKLLRALERRELRRVGGRHTRTVDVRLIAATHLDLSRAVREGRFREDLFFRLNVVRLVLPPLRERGADIELLAETFATQIAVAYGLPTPTLTPAVRTALGRHHWPGNVRELRNAIERALVLSPPGSLLADELVSAADVPPTSSSPAIPFPAPLRSILQSAAREMLRLCDQNKSEAARRLGISRPRLQRLLDGDADGPPDSFGD